MLPFAVQLCTLVAFVPGKLEMQNICVGGHWRESLKIPIFRYRYTLLSEPWELKMDERQTNNNLLVSESVF